MNIVARVAMGRGVERYYYPITTIYALRSLLAMSQCASYGAAKIRLSQRDAAQRERYYVDVRIYATAREREFERRSTAKRGAGVACYVVRRSVGGEIAQRRR